MNNKKIRNFFPFFKKNPNYIYFDSSSTTLKPKIVINKIIQYYSEFATNNHNFNSNFAYNTYLEIENVRKKIINFINGNSKDEIIFTPGSTFSINQIAFGISHLLFENDEILITKYEHSSNILPWYRLAKNKNLKIKFIPLKNFEIDLFFLKEMINSKVKIISFANVSNSIGNIQNVELIIKEIRKIKSDILFIIDCAQSISHFNIDVKKWDADFIFFSGHKMFGPTGIGVLWGKKEKLNILEPLILGGGSVFDISNNGIDYFLKKIPFLLESGTLNIAGIFGLGSAIDFINYIGINQINKYEQKLKLYAIKKLKNKLNDKIIIYNENILTPIIIFNIKGFPAEDIAMHLGNKNKIIVRSGNHCAKLINNLININSTIRISFSIYNNKFEIDYLINSLLNENHFLGGII